LTATTLQQSMIFEPKYHDFVLKCKKEDHARYMREWRLKHPEYRERQKQTIRRWLENHPDYIYKYNKKWRKSHPFNVLETTRKYRKRHPEYRQKHRKRYAERHPDRNFARHKALNLKVEVCVQCGSTEDIHRHHPDYSKPLEIISLCRSCHNKLHKELSLEA
jgi:hypothetical protein